MRGPHNLCRRFSQGLPKSSTEFSTAVKVKADQIDRLVDLLLKLYQSQELMALKTKEAVVRAKIKNIIARNFEEEEAIEAEARKMLTSHAGEIKDMDHFKMFLLIKQKLAHKRGFIL